MAELLSVSEAAERLKVSSRRVRQLIDEGELDASRVGRAWLVDARSVDRRQARGSPGGRPFSLDRVWSIALFADQLAEQFAQEAGGHDAESMRWHGERMLAERLAGPLDYLSRLDPDTIAHAHRDRSEAERALKEALSALRDHKRRERLAASLQDNALFAVESWQDSDRLGSATWQVELPLPGGREDRAAIRRLRDVLAHNGGISAEDLAPLRNRSGRPLGFFAHPSVLVALLVEERALVSGAHAAGEYGADLVAGDEVDAYVPAEAVDSLEDGYGLAPASLADSNVWLRPVPDLRLRGARAPRLFVAADLLERSDPRGRQAARQLLEALVVAFTWYDER